ncbi:hypothetical protein GCM10010230_04690 [Streptomyces narbonensis]|nr:hypothetical protein GCM10010230_04690 [Streptomyces narbonensis]
MSTPAKPPARSGAASAIGWVLTIGLNVVAPILTYNTLTEGSPRRPRRMDGLVRKAQGGRGAGARRRPTHRPSRPPRRPDGTGKPPVPTSGTGGFAVRDQGVQQPSRRLPR